MRPKHFTDLGELYSNKVVPVTNENEKKLEEEREQEHRLLQKMIQRNKQRLINEAETTGKVPADTFPNANIDVKTGKAFNDAGPEAAENFEPSEIDPKNKKKKDSAFDEELLSQPVKQESNKKTVKMESKKINNSTMKGNKNNSLSTFDRLYEDVMGDEDLDLEVGMDDEGLGDEFGDEMLGDIDIVTLELPRDLAEGLHAALMDQLGGGEEDLGGEEDFEEVDDLEDLEGESVNQESHIDLQNAPDPGHLQAMNNKVSGSGHTATGGSASTEASGEEDGGKPKNAPEGFNYSKTKNNKVGGKVTGGNKGLFNLA